MKITILYEMGIFFPPITMPTTTKYTIQFNLRIWCQSHPNHTSTPPSKCFEIDYDQNIEFRNKKRKIQDSWQLLKKVNQLFRLTTHRRSLLLQVTPPPSFCMIPIYSVWFPLCDEMSAYKQAYRNINGIRSNDIFGGIHSIYLVWYLLFASCK